MRRRAERLVRKHMKSRDKVKTLLEKYDLDGIVELASEMRGVAKELNYFLYTPDPLLAWRASEAIGRLSITHEDKVEQLIDRFLWSMNEESGSIGALSAETLGEIAGNNPYLATRIIPTMVHYLTSTATRRGSLWYFGKLGAVEPHKVGAVIPMIAPHLSDHDPEIRAHAALALARMQATTAIEIMDHLKDDHNSVKIYENGEFIEKTVGEIVTESQEILRRIET